jgi:hypothetical protein
MRRTSGPYAPQRPAVPTIDVAQWMSDQARVRAEIAREEQQALENHLAAIPPDPISQLAARCSTIEGRQDQFARQLARIEAKLDALAGPETREEPARRGRLSRRAG